MNIPVVMHKEDGTIYGVTVPDIAGCFSYGETVEQAIENTKDAIYSHVELLYEMGEVVNVAVSPIDELLKNPDYLGGIWVFVEVDTARLDPKPARINVSVPRFILSKIDNYLEHDHHGKPHETRSGFLARAALKIIDEESVHVAA